MIKENKLPENMGELKDASINAVSGILKLGILLIIGIILLGTIWAQVPAGYIGIQDTFGDVSNDTLAAGFHFKSPLTSVIPYTIQTQKYSATATSASKDLQDVTTEVTVNLHIDPDKVKDLYKNIGIAYGPTVVAPAVQESVKASTAEFTASELITNRPLVKQRVELTLSERLKKYNIIVENVSLTDFKFSEQFTKAIEAKVTAEQEALQATNILQKVKVEAEQKITAAQGDANSVIIKANADAYALKIIREQLESNDKLIAYKSIEKWDGKMPLYNGTGALPFIDITKTTTGAN